MDRITKSYVTEFNSIFFDQNIKDDVLFEHFVNYIILERKIDENITEDIIEKLNIGSDNTIGIDGFAIIINGHHITEIDDMDLILDKNKKSIAEVFFIQSKTSPKFENKEVLNFGNAINDFINEKQKYNWNDGALKKIKLFNHLISRATDLVDNPNCYLYYVTLGNYTADKNLEASKIKIIKDINDERLFLKTSFNYVDYTQLQSAYKKITQTITKSFEFENKTLIPEIENVEEAHIGILPVTTIVDLITDEYNELIQSIFYDNVRDFQGVNRINQEINKTLADDKLKYAFSVLNNGITIVAESIKTSRNQLTITNFQVINGLQTSHMLFSNKDILDDNIFVPVKLIVTQDEKLISKIIRSTNRQTEVKEEDLIAYSDFQKKLEDYYKTFPEKERLYYERRSKQFKSLKIDSKIIVDKSTQIKAIGSMFFYQPNLATRFFGALFSEFGKELFKNNHKMLPYYTSSYTLMKLDELFKNGTIPKEYRKIRYFLLMMIKLEINKNSCTDFSNKSSEAHCKEILDIVNNSIDFSKIIRSVISKIDTMKLDLNDNELSKSARLAKDCKDIYFKNTKK